MASPDVISQVEDGSRLSRWILRRYPASDIILVRRLCRSGQIRINSKRCAEGDILKAGDRVRIPPIMASVRAPKPEDADVKFSSDELESLRKRIIHEDNDIVAFDKPAGLAVQAGGGIRKSLDRMAAALFPNDSALLTHRLDRDTSGVLVLAKNRGAAQKITQAFASKEIRKEYVAALAGSVPKKKGVINSPVNGKSAITEYEVMGGLKNVLTFVKFYPMTGRKHQLRIHSARVLGAPIIGDGIYGCHKADKRLEAAVSPGKLYLLAHKMTFPHPSGKSLAIMAEIPEWMAETARLCEVRV